MPVPGSAAGSGSTAWPATVKTAGRCESRISSRAAPPTTCLVTTNGESPSKATTLAAMATPMRVATRAITSMPRLVPPAITTTEPAASLAAATAVAVAAPEMPVEVVAVGVVHRADAVRRELGRHAIGGRADHDRVDRYAAAGRRELAGERHRLERDLV